MTLASLERSLRLAEGNDNCSHVAVPLRLVAGPMGPDRRRSGFPSAADTGRHTLADSQRGGPGLPLTFERNNW
jgi:hypothetical protein